MKSKIIVGQLQEQLDDYLNNLNANELKIVLRSLTQEKKRRKRKKKK